MDFPPDARIPVYGEKAYVKVLRLPKNVQLNFKNNDYYTEPVKETRQKENSNHSNNEKLIDMNINDSVSSGGNSNPGSKFNSSGGVNSSKQGQSSSKSPERQNESKFDSSKGKTQNKSHNNMILINMDENKPTSNNNLKNSVNVDNIDFTAIENNLKDSNSDNSFNLIKEETVKKKKDEKVLIDIMGEDTTNNIPLSQNKSSPDVNKKNNNFDPSKFKLKKISKFFLNLFYISNFLVGDLNSMSWGTTSEPIKQNSNNMNNNVIPDLSNMNKSNYPIDNISSNLDEDTLKEKVDEVVKVIFFF
jgi:hypothetical protein